MTQRIALSEGARRLAQGLVGRLFTEDIDIHFDSMLRYAEPELFGDEWTAAEFPQYTGVSEEKA